jgi:hypothetical protein
MFHAMVTRLRSLRTLSKPRSRNWRNPSTDLMMPNTGLGVCLRRASHALSSFPEAMATSLQSAWGFPAASDLLRNVRPARNDALHAPSQSPAQSRRRRRVHVALAEIPVVREQIANLAQFVGQFDQLPSIGSSCCLSFGACTTSVATTSRLSAATAAWTARTRRPPSG